MAIKKSSNTGIPFGNTAGRPTAATGQPYFNGELGRLELYTSTGWQNIVQETPGIASISGTYNESAGSGTFTIFGTNFVAGGLVYAVGTNGTEYSATTSTTNSIAQMTALFTGLSAAYEPYDIKVLNPSNLFGLLIDAFYINDSPVWSTASGSLGSYQYNSSVSTQLAASDDESNTLTYSVTSGSLPSGITLSSSGLISGTITANPGTYTFTVSVSDGINTAVTRSFSIIVPVPVITGGVLSSDATYYYRTFTTTGNLVVSDVSLNADILTIAGGGAGGSAYHGAGGGAGGVFYSSNQSLSIGTKVVQIGGGGAAQASAFPGERGSNGVNSQFASLTAAVGGGGGNSYGNVSQTRASSGGSGGGGAQNAISGNSLHLGGFGTSGQGFDGGNTLSSGSWLGGGGGGGAGAIGGNGSGNNSNNSTSVAGQGGSGTNSYASWISAVSSQLTGISGWSSATASGYIAGGGSGSYAPNGTPAAAGAGGGGAGSFAQGDDGITNTGSGGGGAERVNASSDQFRRGGNGGSGIVVVRYTKASVGG